MRWRLAALLSVACLALGGVLYWQLSQPLPAVGKAPPTPLDGAASAPSADQPGDEAAAANDDATAGGEADGGSPATDADVFRLPPLSEFSAIIDRPLFTRGRRPAPPSPDEAGAATSADGSSPFLLSGVMIAGGRRVALLQTRASPKTIRVEEGETVQGWKVVAIKPHVVTISSGTNKDELKLPDRIGTPSSPPSSPRQPARSPAADQAGNPNEGAPLFRPPGHPTEQAPDPDMGQ